MPNIRSLIVCCALILLVTIEATATSNEKSKYSPRLFPVISKGKYGYVDEKGKKAIRPRFDYAGPFYEDRAYVRYDNGEKHAWSYIDTKGALITNPRFQQASKFQEGRAAVKLDGKFGFINKSGKVVIEPRYDSVTNFSEGLAMARIGDKIGFIDKKGKRVVKFSSKIGGVNELREGLASVWVGEYETRKYGFVDRTGKMVIKPEFDATWGFSEGLAVVRNGAVYSLIDKKGKVIKLDSEITFVESFSEGLARIRIGKYESEHHGDFFYGYIDKTGEVVIEPEFNDASEFSEGRAAVRIFAEGESAVRHHDLWGYIDKKGEVVIPPEYVEAEDFRGGLARVNIGGELDLYGMAHGGKWGYINHDGSFVWEPTE